MASEALLALGRPDAVESWAEHYASRLGEHPRERKRIEGGEWREALGDISRVGDWTAFFERQLADSSWQLLLETWTARLAPGVMAGATHGIIRTAHAVRSLCEAETTQRLHEYAEGLGYWAARYQELPTGPGSIQNLSINEALRRVPRLDDSRRGSFLIFDAVRALKEEDFGPSITLVTPHDDASAFISETTGVFSRQFIANADTAAIGFIHTVTAPSALRILAPHLSSSTAAAAMKFTWQACAAIYATFGRHDVPATPDRYTDAPFDRDDLIDQAVSTRDEHAIKFTEACLREYALTPDPAFIVAAKEAIKRLSA
jgi:hypothetical protein